MKKYICILILCFAFGKNYSRNQQEVDSLLQVLEVSKEDTNRVHVLNKLYWRMKSKDPELAARYVFNSIELSEKLEFESGLSGGYI